MTVLVVATFLFYVSIESTSGQWSASLLEGRGFHSIPRSLWVGSFWAAFTIGRFAAGIVGNRWRFRTFLDVSALVLVVGLLWLWWSPTPVLGAIGLPLLGLAMASIFPTMVTLMPERVGSDRSPVVMGYAIAAAATGGTIVPIIVGALRDRGSTEVIIPVMAVCTAVMVVLELALRQVERGSARGTTVTVPPVGVEP
jgi:fucose permease